VLPLPPDLRPAYVYRPHAAHNAGDMGSEVGSLLSPMCTHDNIIKLLGVVLEEDGAPGRVKRIVLELAEVREVPLEAQSCVCLPP
jgi:hypothetical protein